MKKNIRHPGNQILSDTLKKIQEKLLSTTQQKMTTLNSKTNSTLTCGKHGLKYHIKNWVVLRKFVTNAYAIIPELEKIVKKNSKKRME